MNLSAYDEKYVRIVDIYGSTFSGLATYASASFLECEYGGEEDGIFIEDFLIYNSQIKSIEEIIVHGTAELRTERLILRKYRLEDVEALYEYFGKDPTMYQYSEWNPYATREMVQETVRKFIESYNDEHAYSWVMDYDDIIVGTIGAYDYQPDQIKVGFSVNKAWQERGFATEALTKVLSYLTTNEQIPVVTAWCADENGASTRVLEKAGMQLVRIEKEGLRVADKVHDKCIYAYRNNSHT